MPQLFWVFGFGFTPEAYAGEVKKDMFMPRLWTKAYARVTASVVEGTEA